MAFGAAVVLTAALLEDLDLLVLADVQHVGGHRRAIDSRSADQRVAFAADHQHFVKRDHIAGFRAELLNAQDVAFGDAVLLTAGLDHCIHDHVPFLPEPYLRKPARPEPFFFAGSWCEPALFHKHNPRIGQVRAGTERGI